MSLESPSQDLPAAKRQRLEGGLKPTSELLYTGKLVYVTAAAECLEAVNSLVAALVWSSPESCQNLETPCAEAAGHRAEAALGFDVEWRASFQRGVPQPPVATVQLAVGELVAVFQLSKIGGIPQCLQDLLGRADVLKVGVGVDGDARKLERDYGGLASREKQLLAMGGVQHAEKLCEEEGLLHVRGLLDLNALARYALDISHARASLSKLCEELLGGYIAKEERIRMGNWEAHPLHEEQLRYAANDAWVGLRCFREMQLRSPTALRDLRAGRVSVPSPALSQEGPAQLVPAAAELKLLAPAKQQVYGLFNDGHSISSIADVRGVKLGTVLGYLGDAIAAGYAYDWSRFGVVLADEEAIASVLGGAPEGLKAIKEALPDHIEYSTIKLVQFHLARKRL